MISFKPAYTSYLGEKQIDNLRLYKYAAVDKSPISRYILKHYWDFAITLFPRWIAPNLITLIGLFFMIANVIVICIWSPNLDVDAPNWINFSFAAGLWLYSTFDNVDGRQARRTGTSSPLGELFDHGCDAVNCTYVALLQAAALGLGHTPSAAILLFVTIAGFYLSTVEEYYTGVLYLGYVNGPTEGIIVTCLAFIWSGVYGVASWHVPVDEISCLAWTTSILPSGTTGADLFVWGMVVFFLVTHLPVCVYSIAQACKEKGLKKKSVFENVFLPLIFTGIFIYTWLSSSPSIIFTENHFIAFAILSGLLFGEMASDIILAHLTKSEYPRFISIYAPLCLSMLIVRLQSFFQTIDFSLCGDVSKFVDEYILLLVLCCTNFYTYIVRAVRVINAFCDFLGIRCLVIPSSKQTDRAIVPKTSAEEEAESLLVAQEEGSNQQQQQQYNTF
ncbi:ethanolaminephosphotransferase 1 [Mucor ambiguus]|uniref:Ethanolaminephosphotransferase 1 n=1 Tax=Mucor ambiguus TaxID=91626 RepID=A0A0C9LXP8_9FUNG|nr:ethanolaminephosphotransferase 1 [Mucor ambiguus]